MGIALQQWAVKRVFPGWGCPRSAQSLLGLPSNCRLRLAIVARMSWLQKGCFRGTPGEDGRLCRSRARGPAETIDKDETARGLPYIDGD